MHFTSACRPNAVGVVSKTPFLTPPSTHSVFTVYPLSENTPTATRRINKQGDGELRAVCTRASFRTTSHRFFFISFPPPAHCTIPQRQGKRGVVSGVQVALVHRRGVKRRHSLVAARGSPPAASDEDAPLAAFMGLCSPYNILLLHTRPSAVCHLAK